MLCLHQQENKQIFTQLVVYQMKNTAREIKEQIILPTIYTAWRVFLKLRNNCDTNWVTNWVSNPVSIRILEVLKTRSNISKPTFINNVAYISNICYNNDENSANIWWGTPWLWRPSSDVSRRVINVIVKEIKRVSLTFLNHLASYSHC